MREDGVGERIGEMREDDVGERIGEMIIVK